MSRWLPMASVAITRARRGSAVNAVTAPTTPACTCERESLSAAAMAEPAVAMLSSMIQSKTATSSSSRPSKHS
ncbi:Uncharacterised protein [Mycobacteroides abscessus subsp. abscessus]|nr:Uncharacterised protein [Mycobacteroides abscessus subsp. abscessus]